MRALFVTHNVPRSHGDAAGSFVLRLAVALQDLGVRVEIVAPGGIGLPARDTIEGITIHRVRYAAPTRMTLAYEGTMVEQVRSSWRGRFALLGLLRALRRATRRLVAAAAANGDPFTIVHAHWWFPAGLALWRGMPRGPARVVTMHGSDVRLALRSAPAQTVMRSVLAQFHVQTAVSSWLANNVMRIAPACDVVVAPMPVDTHMFSPSTVTSFTDATPRPEDPSDDDGDRESEHRDVRPSAVQQQDARQGILFVGRLNIQKGIADVLSALTRPSLREVWLDIVGAGPDRDALESQALACGVTSRIRWHGVLPPEALAVLYRQAQAVVMPSREEGLGLVAVEAQLSETPVVGYASGGLVDVVVPAHGGMLVPVGNIVALADELAVLVSDSAERQRRGHAARAFMESRFRPAVVGTQYRALYQRALEMQQMSNGDAITPVLDGSSL